MLGDLSVRKLSLQNREDFYSVHQAGEYGDFCLCGFWWYTGQKDWNERTEEDGRAQREDLFSNGIFDGYLLYEHDQPVGWCQVYPRDQLPRLVDTYHFTPDPAVWCISCFMLVPQVRGKGLAHAFLSEVLVELRKLGVKTVQAFPLSKEGTSAEDNWTGPQAIFSQAGFQKIMDHPRRPVWEISL